MSVDHYGRTVSYFQTRIRGGNIPELAAAVTEFLATAEDEAVWYTDAGTIVLEECVGEALIGRSSHER